MTTADADETRDKVCPSCHTRFKWYETMCQECQVPLVAAAVDPEDVPLVAVFRTDNPGVVPLARMALDEAGIDYDFRSLGDLSQSWRRSKTEFEFGVPGEIAVRESDAVQARALLADLEGAAAVVPASAAEAAREAARLVADDRICTIDLHDAATRLPLGRITRDDLQLLVDLLEEPIDDAPEYYIDAATIEMIERAGGDAEFVTLLRSALAGRDGMDVRWSRG